MEYHCLNIIYDNRHSDDYQRLNYELMEQGCDKFIFWTAVTDKKTVVECINASHKMIVHWAKKYELPFVVIAEQDLHFPCLGAWDYFVKNMPKEFDVYIGGSYLIDNRIEYNAPLVKVPEWIGNHLIVVSERYYDTFLSVPDTDHIDTVHKDKGEFYLCYPMAALQRAGFSANNKCICNYNSALREGDILCESHL